MREVVLQRALPHVPEQLKREIISILSNVISCLRQVHASCQELKQRKAHVSVLSLLHLAAGEQSTSKQASTSSSNDNLIIYEIENTVENKLHRVRGGCLGAWGR